MNIHAKVAEFAAAWEKQEGYKPAPFQKAIAMQRLLRGQTIAEIIAALIGQRVSFECERPGGCGAARNPIERERNHAADNAAAWYADIKQLMERHADESLSLDERDELEREISEGPLSVLVRDGWRSPYGASEGAEEYEILLSTGGPALRVYGQLGLHDEPESAALQYQDWGTPWTDWYPEDGEGVSEAARTLLAYARCFSFGGDC